MNKTSSSSEPVNVIRIVRCSKCNAAILSGHRCWKCEGITMEKHYENHEIKMDQCNRIIPVESGKFNRNCSWQIIELKWRPLSIVECCYKCTFCNEEMPEHKIVEHQRANHSELALPFTVDQYQLVPPSAKCDVCQSTMYASKLDEHMRLYHAATMNTDPTMYEVNTELAIDEGNTELAIDEGNTDSKIDEENTNPAMNKMKTGPAIDEEQQSRTNELQSCQSVSNQSNQSS